VIDRERLEEIPGVNIDDRLRSVPGFTLFRRSSSLVANPTTQGVSLRGIGSTGASRTLLLWDGMPENDPFGGWVYWDRFAPDQLERIEISRGASTSIFGDLALGGAIGLFSRPATAHHFELYYEGGNENSHELGGGLSHLWTHLAASAFVRAFSTDGYFIVPRTVRGTADRRASVDFVAGNTRLDWFGAADRFFVRFDTLAEHRENGTALTTNATSLGSIAANYSHEWTHDRVAVLGWHTEEGFHASFSSVTNNRNTERLTSLQSVPSNATGGAGFWDHQRGPLHFVAGADAQQVHGVSTDHLFPSGQRVGGGTLTEHGIFGQLDFRTGPATFFLGARHQFTGQDRTFFSPSGGFVIGKHRLRARGSVYRAFRSPTLNELFREFRVGNAVTQANPALRPETMFGAEAGFDLVGESTRASLTFYRNSLNDLITNVTLSTSPTQIIRQRRNAAGALARGIEASIRRDWGPWQAQAAYLFADSRYSTGPRIPQVPRNQGTAQVSYHRKGTLASAGIRGFSAQFEDDINQFLLPGFATLQVSVDQRLLPTLTARAAFENLLDRQYLTGFSPTPTIGSPRLWRLGLRWEIH
jgi:outer membrane receptor protein involved in Fe transport